MVEVVEYTDQNCSYAWGSEPKLRLLRWRYGDRLRWRRVMGGLMPPGWSAARGNPPEDTGSLPRIVAYHAKVSQTTGMPHPVELHWIPVSSLAGNRAVKAAERQGAEVAEVLLRRLREDWYVFGRPADSPERILATAATVSGLEVDRLAADLNATEVDAAYRADWDETRAPNEVAREVPDNRVGWGRVREEFGYVRYGFPTLIFRGRGGEHTVPGWRAWQDYVDALEAAAGSPVPARPDPNPAQAMARWPLLAQAELDVLCGPGARPPADAVGFDSGGGLVWMTPTEAELRAAVRVSG